MHVTKHLGLRAETLHEKRSASANWFLGHQCLRHYEAQFLDRQAALQRQPRVSTAFSMLLLLRYAEANPSMAAGLPGSRASAF